MSPSGVLAAELRELVSREPSLTDDLDAVAGWLQRLCRAAARDLSASGVGVSLLSDAGDLVTAAASDSASAQIEELQFTLGEGPCLAAYASRSPVLVSDLGLTASTYWPGYAPAALEHGVRAVFAFPLQVGAARLGALDVYREQIGTLPAATMIRALTFAEVAMKAILDSHHVGSEDSSLVEDGSHHRFEIHQAQGMVMIQLGVGVGEALARLRAYAYASDRPLSDVADDIIARKLTLESDDP